MTLLQFETIEYKITLRYRKRSIDYLVTFFDKSTKEKETDDFALYSQAIGKFEKWLEACGLNLDVSCED